MAHLLRLFRRHPLYLFLLAGRHLLADRCAVKLDRTPRLKFSIEAQRERLLALCRLNGWSDWDFYIDDGYTGTNTARPQLQRLLADIKAGHVHTVAVNRIDRLSRKQRDVLCLLEHRFRDRSQGRRDLNPSLSVMLEQKDVAGQKCSLRNAKGAWLPVYDFYIVDVFSRGPLTGNQLAVFLRGETFNSLQMQALARETHFSETTFVIGPVDHPHGKEPAFAVRIFTPTAEVPFAGHPTLGTAYVIQQVLLREDVPSLLLELPVGRIPVSFTYRDGRPERLTMRQNQPTFGACFAQDAVAAALSLPTASLDPRLAPQIVSTGLPFLIVPVQTLADVARARLDPDAYGVATVDHPGVNVLLFAREAEEPGHDLQARVFVPEYGVSEDPATGSANGCLCAYLLQSGLYGREFELTVEQGRHIDRPSLLYLNGRLTEDLYDIRVGGRVDSVAAGRLLSVFDP